MGYDAQFRVWRGDADGGALEDYSIPVNEGEVVLDIIHRLQATQTPDLAVRWNCKAGKCGSCSAEINGQPRLMCMTRMSTFTEDEVVTVTPLRAFPVIRDSSPTCRSTTRRRGRSRRSPRRRDSGRASTECSRSTSNGRRNSASASSASSARTRATSSVITTTTSRRSPVPASSSVSPNWRCIPWTRRTVVTRRRKTSVSGCATSPSAAPRCAPKIKITDNAIIPMKERVVDRRYDPIVWLGNKLFRRR